MKVNLDIDNVVIDIISSRLKNIVSPLDIIRWLGNFNQAELKYAIEIASNLTVYTSYEIEEVLNLSFQKVYKRLNKNERIIVNPVGKFGKSGSMISYYFQKTNFYKKNQSKIILTSSLVDLAFEEGYTYHLVLIDDFIGSGKSVETYCKEVVDAIPIAKNQRCLISVAGMEEGISHIYSYFNRIEIPKSNIFKKAFSANSSYFGYRKYLPYRKLAYKYGERLTSPTNKKNRTEKYFNALGYENSQALVSFAHGSPNNTLPIIWSNKNHWFPLIPRFFQDKVNVSRDFRKNISYELSILKEFGGENIQNQFFTFQVKKGKKYFSSVSKIDFSIYSIIKLIRSGYSTVSICQKLGILINDYEAIIIEGKNRGLFDTDGKLTLFGLELYYDAKRCIDRKKKGFDYEKKDIYEIREINYLPSTFNGES